MAPSSTKRLAADLDRPRPRVQPRARAIRAGHAPHERLELVADRAAGGTAILGKQLVGDADPFLGMRPDLAPVLPAVDDLPIAGAVEPGPPPFLLEVAPGALEHRALGRDRRGRPRGWPRVPRRGAGATGLISLTGPSGAIAPSQTESDGSGTRRSGSKSCADSQAFARQAHPLWAVEAEELRAGRVKAQPAGGAGIVRREQEVRPPLGRHDDRPLAELERLLDRFGQPSALGGIGIRDRP